MCEIYFSFAEIHDRNLFFLFNIQCYIYMKHLRILYLARSKEYLTQKLIICFYGTLTKEIQKKKHEKFLEI